MARRTEIEIDPETGLNTPVISRSDLIAAKRAAARPQDLIDVAALRQTEQQQRNLQDETEAKEIERQRQKERDGSC